MKLVVLFILTISLYSVYGQNTENRIIEVKQIGKPIKNNSLNLKLSSKKSYSFDSTGLILKMIKYGRHHYAYLSVIGRVEYYTYDSNMVVETDTTYFIESDDEFNITIDTFEINDLSRKLQYDSKSNLFDSNQNLIQTSNEFSQVKKFEYKNNGLISKITYYYADMEKNLNKKSRLTFQWGKIGKLSKGSIDRINNFIIWRHEL